MEVNKTTTITQRLMNIQHDPIWIKKGASGYNYKYFKKEQIITELKPLLKEQQIGYNYNIEYKETINNKMILEVRIYLFDKNNEETINFTDIMVVDIENKKMDAGQSKGASDTYFWKYALANIFMIPTSDKDLDDIKAKTDAKTDNIKLPKKLTKAINSNKTESLKEKIKKLVKTDDKALKDFQGLLKQYNNKVNEIPTDDLEMLISSYE